jgi:WD40 repeat protein/uncharacterized protein (DUF697 family)
VLRERYFKHAQSLKQEQNNVRECLLQSHKEHVVQNHPKTSFWDNVLDNVQGAANTAGTFLDQIKGNQQFQDFAKQPQIKPFLLALERVDIQSAQKHVQKIMRNHPDWNAKKVADQLILEKAFLLSTQGLVSSLVPGFAAGLMAVDLASSLVAQAELTYQIACAHAMDPHDPARKAEVLTILGLALGSGMALKFGVNFAARNIPVAGALVGAGSNAVITYSVGFAAFQYYNAILSGKTQEQALEESQQASEQVFEEASVQESALDGILAHMILAGHPELSIEDIEQNLAQLPLEEASRTSISKHLKSLRDFDTLLMELQPEYGLVALAQAERLARSDAQVNPQEQKLLTQLEQRFQEQAEMLDTMLPSNYILTDEFKQTIRGAQFSHDGSYLCACSDDRSLKIWKTYDQCKSFQLIHNLQGAHNDEIKALSISLNDELLATASKDRVLTFWDYRNAQKVRQVESGHQKGIYSLAFGQDQVLASGSEDGEIKIWSVNSGAVRRSLFGHKKAVWCLAFNSAGNVLASGSNDDTTRLWNPSNGETIRELKGHQHGVYALAFSADGQTLATGSWDQTIILWDVETGEQRTVLKGHKAAVWQLAFTSDQKFLVSASDDNSIIIWDLATGNIRIRLDGHHHGVYALALSPISSTIASGSWDRSLRIWNVELSE